VSPRIGRPPMKARERKRQLLSVRFSDEEKRSLDRAAKLAGESVSDWARRALLASAAAPLSSELGTPPAQPS
jgi:uncharacterized protein (DUF1778 family)